MESEYPTATDAEISDVLERAGPGLRLVAAYSLEERAAILRRVAQLYRDRADELAAIITREMGKITKAAKGELRFASGIYQYYADNGAELLQGRAAGRRICPGTAWVRKTPIGALLGIMPWNYPYYQVARFAAPNLMIGNTIVLKHAPQCPESALAMEQIFRDAGLPEDAYINVFASNEQVARHDRRPAYRRGVGDRQRAGRIGGRRRGRAEPEEGRAGAGRLATRSSCWTAPTCRRWPRRPPRPGWRTAGRPATRPSG